MLKNGWLLSSDMVDSLDYLTCCPRFSSFFRLKTTGGLIAQRNHSGRRARPDRSVTYSGSLKQRHQAAFAIERGQIVVTANMRLADKHLRHRTAPRTRHHFFTPGRITVDQHLLDVFHAARL